MRPLEPRDCAELHAIFTHPEVRRFLWDDRVVEPDETAAVIKASTLSFEVRRFGYWAAFKHREPELAGFAGLRPFGDPEEVELLYGITPGLWGQGLAPEMAGAVLRYGFDALHLPRIHAGADPPNTSSAKVLQKLGMSFEREQVEAGRAARYFVITLAEWLRKQAETGGEVY
jgi:RimJ/RimL family protein N-acetyltransferase